jgi:Domain of unknown function (DUF4440)
MAMRRILLVFGLMATALPLAAQSADAIIKREEARLAALRSGKGREQFYSRDYITITPPGQVTTGYQPGDPNPNLYFKDVKVLATTQSGAVVTLLQGPRPATAAFKSNDPDRFVDVWANEEGTWRLVARQGVWVRPAPTDAPSRIKVPNVSPYQPKTAIEGEILKANQAIEDAFARHDAAAYERLTLPEFVRIGDYGTITSRDEWIKTNITGNKDPRVVPLVGDVRIRAYGDVSVMTVRHYARDAAGTTPALPLRMMRAWVKRNDGWKLAATITTIVWPAQPSK